MPIEPFDFTYNLTSQSLQNEALNDLGKKRVKEFEPKSYFFTESSISEQSDFIGSYGPIDSNTFRITTILALANKKAYAVTSGQVLVVPQDGSTDKVNVIIKPLKHVDVGVPIKYFIYRGIKKSDFINSNTYIIDSGSTTKTPFMSKVWLDLINFNNPDVPPAATTPASVLGYSITEPSTNRIDSKFFNIYDDATTDENKIYNLPIIEAGQYFGDFKDDEAGFEIVLNDGFYYQEKSDTGYDLDLTFARAKEIILNVADIAANPNVSERIYRENVQNFLDPAAFYGAHITEKEKGEVKVVDTNTKYSTRADIYTNIVSKFYNKHKLYLYIQCNRGRSFNFDESYGTDPLKIGVSGSVVPTTYQTNGWPIIIQELEQTHASTETEAKKGVNTLSFQLKFKTVNKNVCLYNSHGNCANEAIEGNFLNNKALIDDANIISQDYTNQVNYKLLNTYNIGSNSLIVKNIASFIYINQNEKEVEYFNDFFGPIKLDPIAKVVLPPSENRVQKVSQKKKKIKPLFDSQYTFESNYFSFGVIQPPLSPGTNPIDNRTRLYVLREIDSAENRTDKTEFSQYLSSTTDYALADTADNYFSFVFQNKNNRVWKGSFTDQTTSENIKSLQLINLIEETYSKKFTQIGITEIEFNKVIYNNVDNTVSGHLPADATNIYFHLDNSGIAQGTIYKKYKLGVKYDTAGVLFGINTEVAYPSSANEVFIYTLDGHFFFSKAYADKCTYFEEFASAAINFRPRATYQGEFGFDWLRIGDVGEKSYEVSIESGYEERDWLGLDWNTEYDSPTEAYNALKKEYVNIKTNFLDEIYYVPFLNIYPQSAIGTPSPPSTVELNAIIRIDENLLGLKYDYDVNLFDVISDSMTLTQGTNNVNLLITCKKEFDKDQIIKIVASSQNPGETIKNKVAGIIKVCKNSRNLNRNQLKVALVKIRTNIPATPATSITGNFFPVEKTNLSNVMYQSLVYADIEETTLPLENDINFQTGGTYISSNGKIKWKESSIHQYLKTKLLALDSKYKNYCICFSFGVDSHTYTSGGAVNGHADEVGTQVVIVYNQRTATGMTTLAHETLHGMGLFHTHREKDSSGQPNEPVVEPDAKFVFKHADFLTITDITKATDNIMSYNRPNRKSTWRWQWEILKRNIKKYIYQ